jgi:uncharacterized protein (DUF433 family)
MEGRRRQRGSVYDTATAPDRAVGVGLYSYPEAARIVGVPASRLRRWASGYRRRTAQGETVITPVVQRYFATDTHVLTFLELVEILFIKLFRTAGVPMAVIRQAAEEATRTFGTPYPLAVKRFDTDGRRIFAALRARSSNERVLIELGNGQTVFETVVRPFFRKLEYHGEGDALRYWPLEREGRVVLDPERAFGQPIDSETGVPTRTLFDAVRAGEGQSLDAAAWWYGVPLEAVQAAVCFEQSLLPA